MNDYVLLRKKYVQFLEDSYVILFGNFFPNLTMMNMISTINNMINGTLKFRNSIN